MEIAGTVSRVITGMAGGWFPDKTGDFDECQETAGSHSCLINGEKQYGGGQMSAVATGPPVFAGGRETGCCSLF